MAGRGTITISFVLDGDAKGFKELAASAEGFKKVMTSTIKEAEKFNKSVINFAAIAVGIDQAQQSVQQLHGVMADLSSAYAVQVEGETKLASVMRQRMQATDADIESIKRLTSAQQELGIVGDEVQLAGAQQLATFLENKESLEKLIPAMNNLIAHQRGVNASTSDAVAVANRFGKAIMGRAGELSEVGITLTETEKKLITYGDENVRVATLAQIVKNNVGDMNQTLAQTDVGQQKQLENALGDIKEQIGGKIQWAMPFVTMAASATTAMAGVAKLCIGIKAATMAVSKWSVWSSISSAATKMWGRAVTHTTALLRILTAAMRGSAYGATALKLALRGLLVATGIGAAVTALVWAVSALSDKFSGAADAAEEAAGGIDHVKERAERATKVFEDTQSDTYSSLMSKYKELQAQWQSLSDNHSRARWVKANADAFRELGIEVLTVQHAEQAFNTGTDKVVEAFVARAKAAARLAKMTELYRQQMELTERINAADAKAKMGASAVRRAQEGDRINDGHGDFMRRHSGERGLFYAERHGSRVTGYRFTKKGAELHNSEIGKDNSSQYKADTAELAEVNKKIESNSAEIKADTKAGKKVSFERVADPKATKASSKDTKDVVKANAQSYADLTHNIGIYKKQLEATAPSDREKIKSLRTKIDTTEAAAQAVRHLIDGVNAEKPRTLTDIDAALSLVAEKKKKATKESIAGIAAEEKRLTDLREEIERSAHVAVPIELIRTYDQLNNEIEHYSDALKSADAVQRLTIQGQINRLEKLKTAWDEELDELKKPLPLDQLNNIKELTAAISYYQNKQQTAGADEIENIQATIDALERKGDALKRGISLQEMQREVSDIAKLSSKDFAVRIRGIGFDELTAKIKELQKVLADTENPVTDRQAREIEGLIDTYSAWRKEIVHSFDTLREGWGHLKGLTGGIEAMSSALSGNTDAWQMLTGFIDAALQIYDGIMAVVGIINTITTANQSATAVKAQSAAAETAATAATTANTAANAANAVSAVPVIAANKALAQSYLEAASAGYFAAHAAIPFAGVGIAQGFTAAALASVKSIGVTPFAKGGIVSGATLALVGEYAGASNNPEVIAPLDKLRSMIEPQGGVGGNVRFEIEGRKLVGVIANETRIGSKSGRRSNIK